MIQTGVTCQGGERRQAENSTSCVVLAGVMAKKRSSGKLKVGTRVRVKEGTSVPEFADVVCGGWTGGVDNLIGKSKPDPKYVIEWDEATIEAMPADYISKCEESNLFYRMACFSRDDLEVLNDK